MVTRWFWEPEKQFESDTFYSCGIEKLVISSGSFPEDRWFESSSRNLPCDAMADVPNSTFYK